MNASLTLARRFGVAAVALGLAAGAIQLLAGTAVWTGNKNDPVTLGWVTLLLAALLGLATLATARATGAEIGLAVSGVFLIVALLGLTTAGLAWVPAATAGLAAAFTTVRGVGVGVIRVAVGRNWLAILLTVLAVIYLALGITYLGLPGLLGIAGAVAVLAALAFRERSRGTAIVLLVLGAVPFAVVTFWSLVTPLTCVLMLAIGLVVVNATPRVGGA